MSKVSDATTADGSAGWFKIFQDTWAKNPSGGSGDNDYWGTKDLNTCCGKMNVKIPSDLPSGDYLLRAEAIALHTAGSSGGAQFYMTCFQLSVTGSGSATPATVTFPGAYKASDPGILVNIHAAMSTYVAPGPAVYAGGSTKAAGSACSGCESTCKAGSGPSGTATGAPQSTKTTAGGGQATSSAPSGGGSCSVARYGQCGGTGYTGCTSCASGAVCSAVSPPYYSQCV
jgi:cellulase